MVLLLFAGFLIYNEIAYLKIQDVASKAGYNLINCNKPLNQTRAWESIIGKLQEFMGVANISLHSFRSGGTTKAANAQVSERC